MGADPIPLTFSELRYGPIFSKWLLSYDMHAEAWLSNPTTNESVSKCAGIGLYLGPPDAAIAAVTDVAWAIVMVESRASRRHLFLPL